MGANSIDISQYRSRIGTFTGTKSPCMSSKVSSGKKTKSNTIMESFIILSYQVVVPTYHENICKWCMEVHMEDHTGPVLSINVENNSYNINTSILERFMLR